MHTDFVIDLKIYKPGKCISETERAHEAIMQTQGKEKWRDTNT